MIHRRRNPPSPGDDKDPIVWLIERMTLSLVADGVGAGILIVTLAWVAVSVWSGWTQHP